MDYVYSLASDIPGGQFFSENSEHLSMMIDALISSANLTGVSSDASNITVSFDATLSSADKAILDANSSPAGGLIARSTDKIVVTVNGVNIGPGNVVSVVSGLLNTKTVAVQHANYAGTFTAGHGEAVTLVPQSILPISAITGSLNGSGLLSVTVGPSVPPNRGNTTVVANVATFPPVNFVVSFT